MTTNLDLSQKLYAAGVKLETEKWWLDFGENSATGEKHLWRVEHEDKYDPLQFEHKYPTPSTDELLEILPKMLTEEELFTPLVITITDLKTKKYPQEGYKVFYYGGIKQESYPEHPIFNKSLPDALAQMVLYLLDQGYTLKNGVLGR